MEATKLYRAWIRLTHFENGDMIVLAKRLDDQQTELNVLMQHRSAKGSDGMLISRTRTIYVPNLFQQTHDKVKQQIQELERAIHLDLIDYIRCWYAMEYLQILKMKQRDDSCHFQSQHIYWKHTQLCSKIPEHTWKKSYLCV